MAKKPQKIVLSITILVVIETMPVLAGNTNVRKIGTWNLSFLGGDSWQNTIEDIDSAKEYAALISESGATLFALQELTASKFEHGEYTSVYLDELVEVLNDATRGRWKYYIGKQSSGQRLGFLYDSNQWEYGRLGRPVFGGPYPARRSRWPLFGLFRATGRNAELTLCIVNVHMKAMPDMEGKDTKNRAKRRTQFKKLADYLKDSAWDGDLIVCGDTNIYEVQSEPDILLDQDTDKALKDLGYSEVDGENERTAIYEGELSQRFDRFYLSPDIQKEVESAQIQGGVQPEDLVDSLQEAADGDYEQFRKRLSDHFPVVLALDVSKER